MRTWVRHVAERYAEEFRRAAIEAGTGAYAHAGWERLFWRIHRTLRRAARTER